MDGLECSSKFVGNGLDVPCHNNLEHPHELKCQTEHSFQNESDCIFYGNSSMRDNCNIQNLNCVNDHSYQDNIHPINIAFINVCGLTKKLQYPDFIDYINKYDIVCIAETKLDDIDIADIHIDD